MGYLTRYPQHGGVGLLLKSGRGPIHIIPVGDRRTRTCSGNCKWSVMSMYYHVINDCGNHGSHDPNKNSPTKFRSFRV